MTLTQWGAPLGTPHFFQPENTSILNNPMKSEFKNNTVTKISLTIRPDRMSLFSPLLGQGFTLKIRTGISVRDLLCLQIGVSDNYLDQRIQTIFLDGKVVDNVDTAVIRQGSTLALSAAMPGLAGATLRRGGAYAAMRSQISHKNNTVDDSAENGTVILKLFNLVALELGPMFLTQGIWIDGKNLENFFQRVPDFFWDGCLTAEIDGISQDVRKISLMKLSQQQVFLKLK
ncbi:MAG: hypothetical protein OEV45_11785 [Desulfobacteraceae bacterium]|nr:hypothetical protein [Desulfobacteraceae bacterium]